MVKCTPMVCPPPNLRLVKIAYCSSVAWYEWWPADWVDFIDFEVNPGDTIQAVIVLQSPRSGIAELSNHNTGKGASEFLSSTYLLCGQDAEWIVEDYTSNGEQVPFADFGSVTFTGAATLANGLGEISPDQPDVLMYDILQYNEVLTSVVVDGSSVTVSYE